MNKPFLSEPTLSTLLRAGGLLAAAALLGACSSPVSLKEPTAAPVETRTPVPVAPAEGAGANAGAAPQSGVTTVDLASQGRGMNDGFDGLGERIVYFDFDSFAIGEEFRPLIDAHARMLMAQRDRRLVVEGHTDERGGREYNLALGQRRAEAVARSLELLGASPSQIEAVSFGKERPVVMAAGSESDHARNRRAELKDR